jgi:hypothetical protein
MIPAKTLLLLATLGILNASATRLDTRLATLTGNGWQALDTRLQIQWLSADHSVLQLSAATLRMGTQTIANARLECHSFELLTNRLDCRQGKLSFQHAQLQGTGLDASLHYNFDNGKLHITISALPLAEGYSDLDFELDAEHWQLQAHLRAVNQSTLARLLDQAGVYSSPFSHAGLLSGDIDIHSLGSSIKDIRWELGAADSTYSNTEGTQAAEALHLTTRGSATPNAAGWRIRASLSADQGRLYAEPLYLAFSPQQPLTIDTELDWIREPKGWAIQQLDIVQPGILDASLTGRIGLASGLSVPNLQLDIRSGRFPGLYTQWLQPWLTGGLLDDLDTKGSLQGKLTVSNDQLQTVVLMLNDLSVHHPDGLFDIQQLGADIDWDSTRIDRDGLARLHWQSASFYRLQLGAAEVALDTGPRRVALREPLRVPLLDGQLQVDEFILAVENGQLNWLLDGLLTPVSMQSVSTALGWPPLAGTLSGMIPHARYQDHTLTLGGTLLAQAFAGDITVKNLRVRDPLGRVPRLWADIGLKHLDLETLTRTFSFGRIEGRLEGRVDQLYMEVWEPVAFDAAFATPADNPGRRRISQRAVDNISNLGGNGLGGALSRSFLNFMEDFPYRALGISCRLENGVCHMGGVRAAERGQGYYLVEGRWIPPRLDVLGYADAVDWQALVQRLRRITAGEAAVIQ